MRAEPALVGRLLIHPARCLPTTMFPFCLLFPASLFPLLTFLRAFPLSLLAASAASPPASAFAPKLRSPVIGALNGSEFPAFDLSASATAATTSSAPAPATAPTTFAAPAPTTPARPAASASASASATTAAPGPASPPSLSAAGATPGSVKWSVGRAPWYNASGQRAAPFFIGVTGGSASGKTSVCKAIVESLDIPWVGLLSMDRFYRSLTPEEQHVAHQGNYNFDHPNAFDMDQLFKTVQEMRTGRVVDVPIYDFATHARLEQTDRMYGVDVVIVEGILLLYDKRVRDLMDLKIYVDTDSDLRLARRISRDIRERGRSVQGVLDQYQRTVKPSFEEFILPTKRFADLIVPWNDTNHVAIDLLKQHIVSRLEKRSADHVRAHRAAAAALGSAALASPAAAAAPRPRRGGRRGSATLLQPNELPPTVTLLEPTRALRALHTQIRDRCSHPDDFESALGRIVARILMAALDTTPAQDRTVTTPTGTPFHGAAFSGPICTVSVVRTGEVFESAIRSLLPDVPVGKIVIQQAVERKVELGPRLYYAKLPRTLAEPGTTVFLFDGVLATGGAVSMAVQVLLDHGVREEDIVFCCILAAPQGLHAVTSRFPALRVVTSWIDDGLDANSFVTPGVGYLGDRYYGTGAGAPGHDEDGRRSPPTGFEPSESSATSDGAATSRTLSM